MPKKSNCNRTALVEDEDDAPLTKRAKWTKEQAGILINQVNQGEPISQIAKLFPKFTKQQIHSKISSLKQAGKINPTTEGIAPSMRHGVKLCI